MRALLLVILGGIFIGIWFAVVRKLRAGRRHQSEVQKLLKLAAAEGTLTPAQIQAALGYSKEKADAALLRLRQEGLAEFDVDESGAPRYRVAQGAIEARKNKGW